MIGATILRDEELVLDALQALGGWHRIEDIKDACPWVDPRRVQWRLRTLRSMGLVEYREVRRRGMWQAKEGTSLKRNTSASGTEATFTGWADTTVRLLDVKPLVKKAAKAKGLSMNTWIIHACEEKLERETDYER